MSMRPPVDKQRIDEFLRRLGAERPSGRIFLVGGTAMVHQGLRGRTLDVDLTLEPDDDMELLQSIRRLKDEMQVNVEIVSPGDFIPLPAGWHDRSPYVGRYGNLDVFYFDFYSIVLSKIARANERDVDDVVLLIQRGFVDLAQLDATVQATLPLLGTGRYFNIAPDVVAANYAAIRQRLRPDTGATP